MWRVPRYGSVEITVENLCFQRALITHGVIFFHDYKVLLPPPVASRSRESYIIFEREISRTSRPKPYFYDALVVVDPRHALTCFLRARVDSSHGVVAKDAQATTTRVCVRATNSCDVSSYHCVCAHTTLHWETTCKYNPLCATSRKHRVCVPFEFWKIIVNYFILYTDRFDFSSF